MKAEAERGEFIRIETAPGNFSVCLTATVRLLSGYYPVTIPLPLPLLLPLEITVGLLRSIHSNNMIRISNITVTEFITRRKVHSLRIIS